jgi:hypothetical protein
VFRVAAVVNDLAITEKLSLSAFTGNNHVELLLKLLVLGEYKFDHKHMKISYLTIVLVMIAR